MLLSRHKKKCLKVSKDRVCFKFMPSLGTSIDLIYAYQIKSKLVILFQNVRVLFLVVEKLEIQIMLAEASSIEHSRS